MEEEQCRISEKEGKGMRDMLIGKMIQVGLRACLYESNYCFFLLVLENGGGLLLDEIV